jgi:quercetin dioxygenase-like cupin family protein
MKGELDSKILVNRPDKQIVLTTIHEDTEINSFQSDDLVTLKVIGGKLKLHTQKESIILIAGQLRRLHKNIIYSLTTEEETMFLLIIIKAAITPPRKRYRNQ